MLDYQFAYIPKKESISCKRVCRNMGHNTDKIHMHNFEEILLVTNRGACRHVNNGISVEIPTPAVILNRSGSFHAIVDIYESHLSAFVCFFHSQSYPGMSGEPPLLPRIFLGADLAALPLTQSQLEALLPLFSLLESRPISQKRFLLPCILEQLFQLLSEGVEPIRIHSGSTYIFEVAALLQNMSTNADLTLPALASRFHVSQTKLKTDFKKISGLPIHKFRRRAQLQESQILLESTNMELAQIAYACAFNDESYFIRAFRQEYSITPGNYRKKFRT